MKRWITTLGVMLLMPTLAMAQGEMVSVSELRGQVEQMGRWKEKYDTPNGEVSVDVPIIVPEVERCPVVTVENQKPWNETMIREIQKKTEKRDGETFCSYDIDGQTVEIQLLTNGNGSTTKYEAVKDVTIQAGQYAADDRQMAVEWKYPWEVDMRQRYIPGKNWTIGQTMDKWQNILNFVYPGQSIRIAPKRIQICRYENGDSTGFYQITAEQLIEGIPMIGAIASSQAENHFTVPYTKTDKDDTEERRLKPYRKGSFWNTKIFMEMAASDESDYFVHIGVNRVRTVEIDDIPLAPLEEILKRIEREIEAGNIRAVYALRLGYLRYSNPDMTEYACAVPTWVLDCRYLTTENQRTADIFETENQENEERSIWKTYGFSQIPIDAQTGELKIITTGDEETFSHERCMTKKTFYTRGIDNKAFLSYNETIFIGSIRARWIERSWYQAKRCRCSRRAHTGCIAPAFRPDRRRSAPSGSR